MKTTENSILITGGGSGIGKSLAILFARHNNQVLITGRNAEKLQQTAALNANIRYRVCDMENPEDLESLSAYIHSEFPKLNVVIHNAGIAHNHTSGEGKSVWEKAKQEISIHYVSVIQLTESLLPILRNQKESAILNVSSILALSPSSAAFTYSASKAALHSYTQSLRHHLAGTTVRVFELLPPYVDTEMTKGIHAEKLSVEEVSEQVFHSFENNREYIYPGATEAFVAHFFPQENAGFDYLNPQPVLKNT